jgi:hypothetical protein
VTTPTQPQPGSDSGNPQGYPQQGYPQGYPPQGYSQDPTRVPPPAVSSPLAPIVAEKKKSSALNLVLGLALVVAVGGIAFAAGRLTAPASTAAGGGRGGNGTGTGTGFTRGGGNGPVGASGGAGGFGGAFGGGAGSVTIEGTVQSITPTAITLALSSGQTIDIPIDSTTTYHGQQAATSTDVKNGSKVQVQLSGGGFGGFGRGGGQGGAGTGGTGGGANATPPPAVGAPGTVPPAGATGGTGAGGFGRGGAIGPAKDITIVTQ